jgi:hypothetical protein
VKPAPALASLLALSLTACSGSRAAPDEDDVVGDDDDGEDQVTEPDAAPPRPAGYDIVLVAGQSNAVGIGKGPVVELAADEQALVARIDQLGRYGDEDGQIVAAVEPLAHWSNDPVNTPGAIERRGFAYPFALRLAAETPAQRRILIVPTALGGTSILQWNDLADEFAGDTTLLIDDMRARAAAALDAELEPDAENRLVAILWHQGESDINASLNPGSAIGAVMTSSERYRAELEALLAGFRTTFADQGACLPIVMGEVVPTWVPSFAGGAARRDQFTQVIHDVSLATPCTAVAESDGLTSNAEDLGNGDTIHFSAAAQKLFGARYFDAFAALRDAD